MEAFFNLDHKWYYLIFLFIVGVVAFGPWLTVWEWLKEKITGKKPKPEQRLWKTLTYWDQTGNLALDAFRDPLLYKRFPKTMRNTETGDIKEVPHPDGKHWSNKPNK